MWKRRRRNKGPLDLKCYIGKDQKQIKIRAVKDSEIEKNYCQNMFIFKIQ